jgi:hypothetical protein
VGRNTLEAGARITNRTFASSVAVHLDGLISDGVVEPLV